MDNIEDINFENIRNIDAKGNEYWYARELQKVLEYKERRNFEKVINKAIVSAENSISENEDWLVEVNKPIKTGKGIMLDNNFDEIVKIIEQRKSNAYKKN